MTPRPSRTGGCFARASRCFCSVLPVALFLFSVPSPLFHREIVLRRSSFTVSSFFLLGHRQRAFDTNSAPDLLPLFPQCARAPLFFQIHVSLALSRFASLRPFLPPPLPALPPPLPLPHPSFPRPRTLRPVVAFFWSLFSRVELVFLPARRQVRGCSRMGRMEGRGRGRG